MSQSKFTYLLGFLMCAVLLTTVAWAAPPIPGTYDPETMTFYETGQPVPVEPCDPGPLRAPGAYRSTWYFPVLFICAADQTWTYTVPEWSEQLFTMGSYDPGSMRDYYREVSYNQFDIDGITLGWITADYPYEHYHQNNYGFGGGAAEMAREAVIKAEAMYNPDWSQFDNDGDGAVDGVVIIHQGPGGEGGDPTTIWSHVSGFETLTYDGVTLSRYSIQPETKNTGVMETIGTICHEHGHVLGLPDLYDISYTNKYTPIGNWCIMAGGSSGGFPFGAKPNHFCAWAKMKLGWVTPIVVDNPGVFTVQNIQGNPTNSVYICNINGDSNEYFLLSNRWMDNPTVFDHMPDRFAGGLMIYHADDNIPWSNDGQQTYWRLVLEDANWGTNDPVGRDIADCGFAADEGNTTFGRYTTPSSDGNHLPSSIIVKNIGNRAAAMTFEVFYMPTIVLNEYSILPMGGNSYQIVTKLENLAAANASNVSATLSCPSSDVAIDDAQATFGSMSKNGGTANNSTNPFVFHSTGTDSSLAEFTLVVTADGGYTSHDLKFTVPVNPSRILIVDDDANLKGEPQAFEVYFEEAMDVVGLDYQTWEVVSHGYPAASIMGLYDFVIWEDGIANTNAPKAGEGLDIIMEFLDQGGDLFWSSHEFIYSQYPYSDDNPQEYVEFPEGSFCREYLHLLAAEQDEYYYHAYGTPGGLFDGMTFTFNDPFSTADRLKWWPDDFITDGEAIPILAAGAHECDPEDTFCQDDAADNTISGYCAMVYQGTHRLMFMSVPIHGLPMDGSATSRPKFMEKVFEWFGVTTVDPCVDIDVNHQVFHGGDEFKLTLKINNPGPAVTADVYVLLDVYGMYYYFWPTWTESLAFETRNLPSGYDNIEVLMQFDWPNGAGAGSNTRFWAAMLHTGTSTLLGNYDFTPIAWE
ncbi:M6 family metalloprotease domain-containing protein [bacterium]|nr:M6 family metalloprotease domain-containing protein [candidate division CSSED10-310 bacterium]